MCKHTRRFIFFHELLGRVQFHFQSETEQSFLYDFRFCYFIVFQSALSLRSSAFFKTLNLVGTCYLNPCFAKRMLGSINDTNYVRFISNFQRFPKTLELIRCFWYYRPKSLMSQSPFSQYSHYVPVLSPGHSMVK